MDKVKTIKPAASLTPEKAADVAAMRQVIEDYITGKVSGVFLIWAIDGEPEDSDMFGDIDARQLYVDLEHVQQEIMRGLYEDD